MDIIEKHKAICTAVLKRAELHIQDKEIGPTYFCRKAGVQIHALEVVRRGTATPETLQKLSDYLDRVVDAEPTKSEGEAK